MTRRPCRWKMMGAVVALGAAALAPTAAARGQAPVATAPTAEAAPGAVDAVPCFGIVLPSAQLLDSDPDAAEGLRVLVTSYLTGPTLQTMALEARLTAQAVAEARQKSCHYVVATSLTQKRRSGRFGKFLGDATGAALWRLPGTASAGALLATAGVQAAATLASSTRARDEVSLEYRVLTADGGTLITPTTEKIKADADGQDVISPLVARAAEAIVAAAASRR
jgi:hypothetical protein